MIESFGQFDVVTEKEIKKLFLEFNNGASVLIATNNSLGYLENIRKKAIPFIKKCFKMKGSESSPLEVSDKINWEKTSGAQKSQDLYFGYFEIAESLSKKQSTFDLTIAFQDEKVIFDSFNSKEKAEEMAEGLLRAVSFC